MSVTTEQLVARAMRDVAERIALPAESSWVPETRPRAPGLHVATVVAAAALIVAAGVALGAFRESRTVPATQPNAFKVADDAEWSRIRAALPADVVVLRPTWIPAEFTEIGTSDCVTPLGAAFAASAGYDFNYRKGKFIYIASPARNPAAGPSCAKIEITRAAHQVSGQLTEVGVLNERGTTVQVRTGPRVFDVDGNGHQLIYLNWIENGTQFELSSLDLEMPDLLRVLRSLEPVK